VKPYESFAHQAIDTLRGIASDGSEPVPCDICRELAKDSADRIERLVASNYVALVCKHCGCFADSLTGVCGNCG